MFYREFLPPPPLRPYIHLYGVLEEPLVFEKVQQEKTPPAINKGLMFHYRRDNFLKIDNNTFSGDLPRGFIMPQCTNPQWWTHHGGFGIFSIIFKPGKFGLFFPDPFLEFIDRPLSFELYNDKNLLNLHNEMMEAQNNLERLRLANEYLSEKLKKVKETNQKVQFALNLLLSNPQLNIKQICNHLEYGERHFHRTFSRTFGLSPKKFQCLLRINKVINLMGSGKFQKLTDIAYQAGYADQAHFIRDFKSYTNMTPKAFLKSELNITSLINFREEVVNGRELGRRLLL
ncbi:MAG: AraC family transcriptional regulator [Bacteroidetes bacterium]|nr:MAG: AraC family transcriptional regulator [Bacteroidota bacterium]